MLGAPPKKKQHAAYAKKVAFSKDRICWSSMADSWPRQNKLFWGNEICVSHSWFARLSKLTSRQSIKMPRCYFLKQLSFKKPIRFVLLPDVMMLAFFWGGGLSLKGSHSKRSRWCSAVGLLRWCVWVRPELYVLVAHRDVILQLMSLGRPDSGYSQELQTPFHSNLYSMIIL